MSDQFDPFDVFDPVAVALREHAARGRPPSVLPPKSPTLDNPVGTEHVWGDTQVTNPTPGVEPVVTEAFGVPMTQRTFDALMSRLSDYAMAGPIAFHASPARFGQFLDKARSGNGSAAHGRGTYVAAGKGGEQGAREYQALIQGKGKGGAFYKVDIPDHEHFLPWELPSTGKMLPPLQDSLPEPVVKAILGDPLLLRAAQENGFGRKFGARPNFGRMFYEAVGNAVKDQIGGLPAQQQEAALSEIGLGIDRPEFGKNGAYRPYTDDPQVLASYYLNSKGILGTYLDRTSAGLGEHYAVFHPSNVKIIEQTPFEPLPGAR